MAHTFAATLETYRSGTSFADLAARLKYFFVINKIVGNEDKKAYFITLGGPVVFSQLKLLYPTGNFDSITYDEMIIKLTSRLDKTESKMIQRLKFNIKNQQPNEFLQDCMQAEFCGYGVHEKMAIVDRIVAGVRDNGLRKRLLSEEKLPLAVADKILQTWEMATTNSKTFATNSDSVNAGEVLAVNNAPMRVLHG